VLPVRCAGCERDDDPWCPACRSLLDAEPWRCEDRAGRLDPVSGPALPVLALADCVGPVRATVVAWKDRGRRDLTAPLVAHAGRLGTAAAALVPAGPPPVDPVTADHPTARACVLVVPAPSTAAARRRRGFGHVDELARGVADGLRVAGVPARAARVLRRRGADQAGLGVRERAQVDVHVAARARAALRGAPVVLVDDVLTSGATLAAAARAVAGAGALPVAATVLASTPGPRRPGAPGGADHPRVGPDG